LVGVSKPGTNTPPIEELIEVDAMITETAETEYYVNPAVTLTLLEPEGCEFVTLNEALQSDMVYEFLDHLELDPLGRVTTTGTTTLRASVVNGDKERSSIAVTPEPSNSGSRVGLIATSSLRSLSRRNLSLPLVSGLSTNSIPTLAFLARSNNEPSFDNFLCRCLVGKVVPMFTVH
jgi:hypothetical protein